MPEAQRKGSPLERIVERMNGAGPEDRAVLEALLALIDVVGAEAARTPRFARALGQALLPATTGPTSASAPGNRRVGRREAGVIDPFEVLNAGGVDSLRERLSQLSVEQLKDVIAEHGMDRDRLAMKWKDTGRLIDRIVETAATRANKGHAFRADEPATASDDPAPAAETSSDASS